MTGSSDDRLESWKQIASFIGRDERTAMRWAKEYGMPVHRDPGERGRVYAYREEIDRWRAGQPGLASGEAAETRPAARRPMWQWVVALACGALAIGLAAVGATRLARSEHAGPPVRVRYGGNKLVALDEMGQTSWEYSFPNPIAERYPAGGGNDDPIRFWRVMDFFGNGHREVLAVVPLSDSVKSDELIREELDFFSEEGKLLWRYVPEAKLRFGGKEFEGPWWMPDLLVLPDAPVKNIWIAVSHNTWWPSFVARVDPSSGKATIQYVSSGQISSLNGFKTPRGEYVLAGGFNNEYDAGSLAVIDASQPPAASPQTAGQKFACTNCPAGRPVRYFVFPRTEVNLLQGGVRLNKVVSISRVRDEFHVATEEIGEEGVMIYVFAARPDFLPKPAMPSDGVMRMHRRFEREGKIKHSWEKCPARFQPRAVRLWTPEKAWEKISVPVETANN